MSYFLFSGLTAVAVGYYLLFYTDLWPLVLAYITFIYWDFDSYNRLASTYFIHLIYNCTQGRSPDLHGLVGEVCP
jgi:hypothetical protein